MAALTPFVPSLLADVEVALRAVLGVPASVALSVRDDAPTRESALRLAVQIGDDPALALRLRDAGDGAAWWRGAALAIDHAAQVDASGLALLSALQRRLTALAGQSTAAPWSDLVAALGVWRQFRAVPAGEFAVFGDRELLIRLLFRCNQDCSFCWQDRGWPPLPVAWAQRWIAQAVAAGCHKLTLSGGEPTLHPDLVALVGQASAAGLVVTLQTNGIRLAQRPALLTQLVAAGLRGVVVSYHAADAALSDTMTAAPGTHAKTEAAIVACLRAGLRVALNCVVDRRNAGLLLDHAQSVVARFGPEMRAFGDLSVSYSHPNAAFDSAAFLANQATLDEVRAPLAAAIRALNHHGVFATAAGNCGFPLCALVDVLRWVPRPARRLPGRGRAEAAACQSCALTDECVGPRRTYLEGFGEAGLRPFATVPPELGADVPVAADAWWA